MKLSEHENSPQSNVAVVWFRQDLRVSDNLALLEASKVGEVLPIYILDESTEDKWSLGGASKWWLHESLTALNKKLEGKLCFARGEPLDVLKNLIEQSGAKHVFWNRCYEPLAMIRDARIKAALKNDGICAKSYSGSLLFEPHISVKEDGTPYRVFTPFFRKGCLSRFPKPERPCGIPSEIVYYNQKGITLSRLGLKPKVKWYDSLAKAWNPGEDGARQRLEEFLKDGIVNYKTGRNIPSGKNVSRLSPHLHFGEISPHRVWHEVSSSSERIPNKDSDHFLSELGWREFSHNLLYHNQDLPEKNLQPKFDRFPWVKENAALKAWQEGRTGYPIVDAGMKELWHTGYIHNRVRMIVASFLVKNLMIDWRLGQRWFWDTLVDADLANNSASWQWVAGSGADAAPFFRIFNPVTQGEKFDPDGVYVKKFLPELSRIPKKYIHSPWLAPKEVLVEATVSLGTDYPEPIVSLKESREKALSAFNDLSNYN